MLRELFLQNGKNKTWLLKWRRAFTSGHFLISRGINLVEQPRLIRKGTGLQLFFFS